MVHQSPLNNLVHLVTTPACLYAVGCLIHWGCLAAGYLTSTFCLGGLFFGIAIVYAVSAARLIPSQLALCNTAASLAIAGFVTFAPCNGLHAIGLFIVAYLIQDLGHWVCGEQTYQSTYLADDSNLGSTIGAKLRSWLLHTFLLLPLVMVACWRRRSSPLRLFAARQRVAMTALQQADDLNHLDQIRCWASPDGVQPDTSVHFWACDLEGDVRHCVDALANNRSIKQSIRSLHDVGTRVEPVTEMNELYVTGPPKTFSSDTVFYTSHIDGPWAVWPGASVYRVMLGASENRLVTTHFPTAGTVDRPVLAVRIERGDAIGFDFNREPHYITRVSEEALESTPPRVNLKLHFVAFPSALPWYGRLLARWTSRYDHAARQLFLNTLGPVTWLAKLKAAWILACTRGFEFGVRRIGWSNLVYVAAAVLFAAMSGQWVITVALLSYVHYIIYAATIREPGPVSFHRFVRDATFFKVTSFILLLLVTVGRLANASTAWWTSSSPWLIAGLFATGAMLSGLAALRLGVERTFFAFELAGNGRETNANAGCEPPASEKCSRFPYGVIPHPMAVGSCIWLIGLGLIPVQNGGFGWLIPGHLIAYGLITWQEVSRNSNVVDLARDP